MKGFFKVFGIIAAACAALLGALFIFDRIQNKNAIKDEYLDCSNIEDENK